jgi:hypothetical protein
VEVPLWSGLRLQVLAQAAPASRAPHRAADARLPLRDVEIALIRKAVQRARGNVMASAPACWASAGRPVYRKLGPCPAG